MKKQDDDNTKDSDVIKLFAKYIEVKKGDSFSSASLKELEKGYKEVTKNIFFFKEDIMYTIISSQKKGADSSSGDTKDGYSLLTLVLISILFAAIGSGSTWAVMTYLLDNNEEKNPLLPVSSEETGEQLLMAAGEEQLAETPVNDNNSVEAAA